MVFTIFLRLIDRKKDKLFFFKILLKKGNYNFYAEYIFHFLAKENTTGEHETV